LAKFKKKKSKPTPEPEDSTKESVDSEISDTPEIEKSESTIEPSKEPKVSEDQKNDNEKKLNKLFWLRVALGVIAGAASTFLFESIEGEERRWASIVFLIIVFIVTNCYSRYWKFYFSLFVYLDCNLYTCTYFYYIKWNQYLIK
jgi:hypothetical protein